MDLAGLQIERRGVTTGRWQNYLLIVNGVSLGRVKQGMAGSGDRLSPRVRYAVWEIHGLAVASREAAERELIRRAIRFGTLKIEA
jgi:hypothetical protein